MKALAAASLPVALFVAGCSSNGTNSQCTNGPTTLEVTVQDSSNESEDLCSDGGFQVSVTATGPSSVTFVPSAGSGTCSFLGTVIAGSYEVAATATGYEKGSTPITIQAGCSQSITIDMTAAPP